MNYHNAHIQPDQRSIAERALLREHYADWLFDRVVDSQRKAPIVPTLESPAVSVSFLHAWNGVGGFLLCPPSDADLKVLTDQRVEFRSFRNEAVATRARRIPYKSLLANDEAMPEGLLSPLFLNAAHYPGQQHLETLRHRVYADASALLNHAVMHAGEELTGCEQALSREQRIALFMYREVDGNFTVGINNALTLREELFHTLQKMLKVSYSYMSHLMLQDADTPALVSAVLKKSKGEQISNRNAGLETPYERMERRLGYLLSDRELQARLDKICVEIGKVPGPYEDPVEFFEKVGLALGGIKDFEGCGNSIWERSMIAGRPSRALAELNFAITAAFPDGISDFFRNVALPYHAAQVVRVNSFDSKYEMIKYYGFKRSKAFKDVGKAEPKLLRGLERKPDRATAG